MALLSVIRRWHFRDGIAIREIVRRTGLSRNTVRKYLSSGDVEPSCPKRKMPSKLDAYEATLRCWLQRESFLCRKDRRCIGEMHVDLVCLGYSGSYDRVAVFARQWREERRKAADLAGKGVYVPLFFAPGEAFQFLLIRDTPPVGMYVLNMFCMRGSRLWGSRLHRACVV